MSSLTTAHPGASFHHVYVPRSQREHSHSCSLDPGFRVDLFVLVFHELTRFSKVLRWSALLFGVFYGFTHQRSLNTHAAAAQVKADYKHKEDLIQKAKLEWKKKTTPQDQKTAGGDSMSLEIPHVYSMFWIFLCYIACWNSGSVTSSDMAG